MVACFIAKSGHVVTIALEDPRTVNADWSTTIFLPEVIDEWRKNNSKRAFILHHDNVTPHIARVRVDYLQNKGIELLSHPAHSPDLSPNHFFTFRIIKNKMRGLIFRALKTPLNSQLQNGTNVSVIGLNI